MSKHARKHHVLVHQLDDELVIYDKDSQEAHRLNATVARVWNMLDGEKSDVEIASALDLDESVVELAIDELVSAGLVQDPHPISVSRREALRRVAAAAGAGILLPAVTSMAAPFAAQAQSRAPAKKVKKKAKKKAKKKVKKVAKKVTDL